MRRAILSVLPKTIRFHGYQLAVNPEDHIMGSALLRGSYEPYGTKLFLESLKPGMNVVDCGANIGIYTCLASGAVGPTGKVYSFEPEPRNFACLTETIRLNHLPNVQPEQLALSDRNEQADLFLSEMNMGDHRLGKVEGNRPSVRIQTIPLDSYWGQVIPQIDVLKLDVQGAEGLALKGMRETLTRSPNLKIFMEFWPSALRNGGTDPREVLQELLSFSFFIKVIDQEKKVLRDVEGIEQLLAPSSAEISFDLFLERNADGPRR